MPAPTRHRGFPDAAVCAGVVLAVSYLVLTTPAFQAFVVNSDQLTIISLADDILFNPKFNPFLWNFSRAPYFFPDLAATLGLRTVIHGDAAMAAAMLMLQSAFAAGTGVAISTLLAGNARRRAGAAALYGLVMVAALAGVRQGWFAGAVIWPFISYSHAGALDMTLVGFIALSFGLYAAPGRPAALALSLAFTVLAYCSDKIAIALFLPPAALYLIARREGALQLAIFVGIQVLALASVLVMDRFFHFQVMEEHTLADLPSNLAYATRFASSLPLTLQAFLACGALAAAGSLIRSSTAFWRTGRACDAADRLAFLIAWSSAIDVLLCLWLWNADDGAYLRYAVMAEFAGPPLILYALSSMPFETDRLYMAAPSALAAALLLLLATWQGPRDPFDMARQQRRSGAAFAACVAKNGLHAGYAAYWRARMLSSSTNWAVQVDQFAPTEPVPFFWGSDLIWFFDRLRGGAPTRHDFILLDDLPSDQVEAEYGRPDEVEICGAHRLAIYRDWRKLEDAVASRLGGVLTVDSVRTHLPRRVLTELADRKLAFGVRDLDGLVGDRVGGSVRLSPAHGEGFGLFGPFISMVEGTYDVDVAFACSGKLDGSFFDVWAGEKQRKLAEWRLGDHTGDCDGQPHRARMAFDVRVPVSLVETRAYYGGQGELSVTEVRMRRSPGT